MRSTSNAGHHHKISPLRSSTSRIHLGPPLQLDSSPVVLRSSYTDSVKQKDDGAPPDTAVEVGSHLPSSHLAAPDNALGLFLEPEPFPSELLPLDLAQTAQFGLSPRSEADFFLGQGGGSFGLLNSNSKSTCRVFTRSPAIMSEASSLVPSPSTYSDESLPKLSLAHRQDLNKSNIDPSLELPALKLSDAAPGIVTSPAVVRPAATFKDESYIYKMPILRAMSPLADLSSDSDDDSDEPLATSSMLPRSSLAKTEHFELPVPQEGRTGEIFAALKTILPLSLTHPRNNTTEKLFCKLDSTSHQCFSVVDGKWACYRRNYLKVDVVFHYEDEQGRRRDKVSGDLICEPSGRAPFTVERFAVHMTAHVMNHDGRLQKGRQGQVPLIQFGPARERGPREAVRPVELRSGGQIGKDASANEQAAARSGTIAAFRRVQIRSATMNNGQRGAASQQFYALKLTLLAYPEEGAVSAASGVEVASLISHPITVRGRSKVHYAPAGSGASANKGGAKGSDSRSLSAVASANRKSAADSNRRGSHSCSHSGSTEKRRSSRLLLSADRGIEDDQAGIDGDDEPEAEQQPIRRVMDIRSII